MVISDTSSQFKGHSEHDFDNMCNSMDETRREKLVLIESGQNPEPPIKWFKEICLQIDREQPNITAHQKRTIVSGMWNDMTKETKIEVIQEYERWCLN